MKCEVGSVKCDVGAIRELVWTATSCTPPVVARLKIQEEKPTC